MGVAKMHYEPIKCKNEKREMQNETDWAFGIQYIAVLAGRKLQNKIPRLAIRARYKLPSPTALWVTQLLARLPNGRVTDEAALGHHFDACPAQQLLTCSIRGSASFLGPG